MCRWGTSRRCRVTMPANLSHTGKARTRWVSVDSCIADIVRALNRGGVKTANSCCGHGKRRGTILLHDGRELIVSMSNAPADLPALAGKVRRDVGQEVDRG